ncbi:P34 probable thiol protease-like [Neltuma alba]|uniref:P34 probable thiol protease-like n=1 Tax=Neltuma alba TaxID=207710 RepID=UPI0010A563DE|nr:P34 probable thiol protease-like [Prosopis alba]
MQQEITTLEANGTWELVSLPPGKHVIDSKWVFKIKYLPSREIDCFKARLIAHAKCNSFVCQLDVNTAFLHGDLDEEWVLHDFGRITSIMEDKETTCCGQIVSRGGNRAMALAVSEVIWLRLSKEDDYPYVREKGYCKAEKQSVVKINGSESVEQSDDSLMRAIASQPITVGLDATALQFYQGGIIDGENCPMGTQPNHAVLIVGYDSKDGKDYWIVKKSWGEDWGMNGYFMIQRNSNAPNGVLL